MRFFSGQKSYLCQWYCSRYLFKISYAYNFPEGWLLHNGWWWDMLKDPLQKMKLASYVNETSTNTFQNMEKYFSKFSHLKWSFLHVDAFTLFNVQSFDKLSCKRGQPHVLISSQRTFDNPALLILAHLKNWELVFEKIICTLLQPGTGFLAPWLLLENEAKALHNSWVVTQGSSFEFGKWN